MSWLGCPGHIRFSGIAGGSVAFFGVSGLGRLGGRFGVVVTRGEAVGVLWEPGTSPILMSAVGLAVAQFVLGGRRRIHEQIVTNLALWCARCVNRLLSAVEIRGMLRVVL